MTRGPDERDPASYSSWADGGFRGPPPSRRGLRAGSLALSLALAVGLAVLVWFAVSGRLS